MLSYTKELLVQRGRDENEEGRLLEGGPSSQGLYKKAAHSTHSPAMAVRGRPWRELPVCYCKLRGGQQREQHVMCEAAHFMTVIPGDLEMVSDDGFLPVLYEASTAGFIWKVLGANLLLFH